MPFNIGPGELILILIIALVVLGPGKLPDVAASLGKSVREFRKAATDISDAGKLDAAGAHRRHAAPTTPAAGPAASSRRPNRLPRRRAAAPRSARPQAGGEPARDPNAS